MLNTINPLSQLHLPHRAIIHTFGRRMFPKQAPSLSFSFILVLYLWVVTDQAQALNLHYDWTTGMQYIPPLMVDCCSVVKHVNSCMWIHCWVPVFYLSTLMVYLQGLIPILVLCLKPCQLAVPLLFGSVCNQARLSIGTCCFFACRVQGSLLRCCRSTDPLLIYQTLAYNMLGHWRQISIVEPGHSTDKYPQVNKNHIIQI